MDDSGDVDFQQAQTFHVGRARPWPVRYLLISTCPHCEQHEHYPSKRLSGHLTKLGARLEAWLLRHDGGWCRHLGIPPTHHIEKITPDCHGGPPGHQH